MPLLAAVGLLSAAAIGFEVLLARLLAIVLWQHFAAMIISLALLGYGASGTLLVLARSRLLPRFGTSFALLAAAFGVAAVACSALAKEAAARLTALGYGAVQSRQADGYYGWPEAAPFDAIVVTAAVPQVPPPLLEQLKPGGRMVIPVGAAFLVQELLLIEKLADRTIRTTSLLPVAFVPLSRTP